MNVIYMDNNATTQVLPEVLAAMLPYFTDSYANPSSMHKFGGNVRPVVENARDQLAALLNADPREIMFTSCGTESDNAAIFGTLESYPEKRHVITTRVEHPAVRNTCQYLQKKGYRITELAVNSEGCLNLDELKAALSRDTALVSIMYANNETGVIFPIEEIGQLVKARGAVFHVDAVQAVGKIPIDLKKSTIDLLSLSGHKLHAPKGIGALYIRRGTKFRPFIHGGHQERGRRGGTENVSSIIGLGQAAAIAQQYMDVERRTVKELRDHLETNLLAMVPNSKVNGQRDLRLPNTCNISFKYVEGEAILLLLDEKNICASSGSACTSGSLEPSHVLRAMGIPFTYAHGSIRFSLSRLNTRAEVDTILSVLPPIISRLREISPFSDNRPGFENER